MQGGYNFDPVGAVITLLVLALLLGAGVVALAWWLLA